MPGQVWSQGESQKKGSKGFTNKSAPLVTPFRVAEIVANFPLVTALVFTSTLTELAPAGIVTLAETIAMRGLLLNSFTTKPPEGAGLVIVTVACEESSPLPS